MKHHMIYMLIVCANLLLASHSLFARELSDKTFTKLVFEDDFSGSARKKGWKFASSLSVLENGMLRTKAKPGHGAIHGHVTEPFQDAVVSFRFKPLGKKINMNVQFNDREFKDVHAGHVCRVMIKNDRVIFQDDKFGTFKKAYFDRKRAGEKLDKKTLSMINSKKKTIKYQLSLDWHDVKVIVEGDVMQISIDDQVIGSFKTEGNAHPTKRHFGINTGYETMYIDDVKFRVK